MKEEELSSQSKIINENEKIINNIDAIIPFYSLFSIYLFLSVLSFYQFNCNNVIIEFAELELLFAYTNNELDDLPTIISTGKYIRRYEADIYRYDCLYYFYDNTKKHIIEESLLDGFKPDLYLRYMYAPIIMRYCEKLNIYHLKNVFIKPNMYIVLSNGDNLMLFTSNGIWENPKIQPETITPQYGYNILFYVPIVYNTIFSHWIIDGLSWIILMPSWFWDLKPTILSVVNTQLVEFTMNLIGLGNINVINTGQYVYGKDVYLVHANELWNCMGAHSSKILKKKFRESLGLNKIKPTKYNFISKEKGNRYFTNLNEIIELANKKTNKHWTLITTSYTERL